MSMAQTVKASSIELTRDGVYYFEDGDCILQVENYLFNLHRFILRRNSTFFRNLFSMPQTVNESGVVEGDCDEYPIVCNDSAKAFRPWCWALYAGLKELEGQNECDLYSEEGFAHIGLLSHKYECGQIEQWARRNLDSKLAEYLDTRYSSSGVLNDRNKLVYLVRTSMQCNWTFAKRASEKVFLEVVSRGWNFAGIWAFGDDLSAVLKFSGSVDSAHLKAEAYYAFLECVGWALPPTIRTSANGEGDWFVSPAFEDGEGPKSTDKVNRHFLNALTDAQKATLYRGLHALSSLRVRLQTCPEVNNPCSCSTYNFIVKSWSDIVSDLEKQGAPSCPEKFLKEVKKRLDQSYQYQNFQHSRTRTRVCTTQTDCGWFKVNEIVNKFSGAFDSILVDVFSY